MEEVSSEIKQYARDYFHRIYKLGRMVRRLKASLKTVESYTFDNGAKADPILQGRKVEDAAEKALTLRGKIEMYLSELLTLSNDAFERIGHISDFEQQNVMIARYIQHMDWDAIADELEFSPKWVLKLHRKAMDEFAQKNTDFLIQWHEQTHEPLNLIEAKVKVHKAKARLHLGNRNRRVAEK